MVEPEKKLINLRPSYDCPSSSFKLGEKKDERTYKCYPSQNKGYCSCYQYENGRGQLLDQPHWTIWTKEIYYACTHRTSGTSSQSDYVCLSKTNLEERLWASSDNGTTWQQRRGTDSKQAQAEKILSSGIFTWK